MLAAQDVLFLVAVGWFAVHELDAIRRREWRFFFTPLPVSDETGYRLFVALHLPLFVAILWLLPSQVFRLGFDVFLIGHAGLHLGLRNRPTVAFDDPFSWLWIYGGAVLGAVHLLVALG